MEGGRRYRLDARLGAGGMAEVFKATSLGAEGFSRTVAVKRLLSHLAADEAFVKMFVDEARIASRLHHGGIVAALDYGLLEGTPFQVLEFVDGMDLGRAAKLAREGGVGVPEDVALYVSHEVALALEHAHAAVGESGEPLGIVHRDVSPANVLLGWNGDVKISDFGIAFAEDRLERTRTGVMKGKLGYMPPEQAGGGRVDARTDVFALGCTIHALYAGAPPITSEDALRRLMAGLEPELSTELPDDVRSIVKKAVQPRPADRYADAAALASDLFEALKRRTSGNGRALVAAWLARMKVQAPPSRPKSSLDVLLGLDLVMDESSPANLEVDAPTFRAERAQPTDVQADISTRVETPPRTEGVAEAASSPRRTRWRPLAFGVGAAAVAAGVASWALVASRTSASASSSSSPPPSTVEVAAAQGARTLAATPSSARSTAPTVEETIAGAPSPSLEVDSRRAPSAPRSSALAARSSAPAPAPRDVASSSATVAPASSTTGYLVIAGEHAHGCSVLLDNRDAGVAPTNAISVPTGSHTVTIVCADGRHGPFSVTVGPENGTPAKAQHVRY